ncbi:MAG: hypothetical protein U0736_01845 [Gemmataceae bacterium]
MRAFSRRSFVAVAWVVAVVSLAAVPAPGQAEKKKHITFEASVSPADPFSEQNQAGGKAGVARGDTFFLTVRGVPAARTHPLTRRAPSATGHARLDEGGGPPPAPALPDLRERAGVEGLSQGSGCRLPGARDAVHDRPGGLSRTDGPGQQTIELLVKLHVQVCEKTCVWEDHELKVPVTVLAGQAPPSAELKARLAAAPPAPTVVPLPGGSSPAATAKQGTKADETTATLRKAAGLWTSVLAAILGGFVSLLTPCVFPMIPITVSYFLKQSEAPAGRNGGRPSSRYCWRRCTAGRSSWCWRPAGWRRRCWCRSACITPLTSRTAT